MDKYIAQALLLAAVLALGILFVGNNEDSIKKSTENVIKAQVQQMKEFESTTSGAE